MSDWFDDEEFWSEFYGFTFCEERFAAAPLEVEKILALLEPEPAKTSGTITVYSGLELKDRLLATGFDTVRLLGDLDGGPYGALARRLIAVATRR
jgi:hypothetical protein